MKRMPSSKKQTKQNKAKQNKKWSGSFVLQFRNNLGDRSFSCEWVNEWMCIYIPHISHGVPRRFTILLEWDRTSAVGCLSPQTQEWVHLHIGKTDDNKQIAVHYRNKAIFLLNFTINITLQPKPVSEEMHDNTIMC